MRALPGVPVARAQESKVKYMTVEEGGKKIGCSSRRSLGCWRSRTPSHASLPSCHNRIFSFTVTKSASHECVGRVTSQTDHSPGETRTAK